MTEKTLVITLINNDIFTFDAGSYDRYVVGDKFVMVYYDDCLLNAFNSSQVLMIDLRYKECEDFIYD